VRQIRSRQCHRTEYRDGRGGVGGPHASDSSAQENRGSRWTKWEKYLGMILKLGVIKRGSVMHF